MNIFFQSRLKSSVVSRNIPFSTVYDRNKRVNRTMEEEEFFNTRWCKKHSISPCFDAKRSFQLGNQNTVGSSCSSLFGGKYFIFFRAQIFKLESERDRKLTFIILLVDGGDFFRAQIFQTQPAKKFKN